MIIMIGFEFRKYVTINRSELMINYYNYVVDPHQMNSFKKVDTGRIIFINNGREEL